MQQLPHDAGRAGGPRLFHQVFVPIAGLVILILAALIGSLWHGALLQDRIARDRSVELVDRIIAEGVEQIAVQARDYSWWDETVRALLIDPDPAWADDNIGPYTHETFGYGYTFVVDEAGTTLYSAVDGERRPTDAFAHLDDGILELIRQARAGEGSNGPEGVGGLISVDGVPALAGVSLIEPERADSFDEPPDLGAVLVFVRRLDLSFWTEFADRYAFRDMRVLQPGDPAVMLPLTAINGRALAGLAWQTHRPGAAYFRSALPLVSLATIVVVSVTVLVLRRATGTVVASEARFRDVADAASDWIWETEDDGRLAFLSERFSEVTSLGAGELLGRPLPDLLEVVDGEGVSLDAVLAKRTPFRNLICHQTGVDGRTRIVRLAGKPVAGRGVGARRFRGTATDVTREVEAERQVRFLAMHDPLTGLANRPTLRERLDQAVRDSVRRSELTAVVCIDLDRFKIINDTLGHGAGDTLLKIVAERLKASVREVDAVARLSGDEFAIVQIGVESSEAVAALCRRLLKTLAAPVDLGGHEAVVSGTLGVALAPTDGRDPDQLLQKADIALYRAKNEGRNDFRFFEPEMDARLRERKAIEQELRMALAERQFVLHFQPQFAVGRPGVAGDPGLVGVEALLRWHHPERGLLTPQGFIEVAEETGLMLELGEWVLRETCRQGAAWPGIVMSVNLAPIQFRHRDLVATVERALAEHGLDPRRLELEITERVLLDGADAAFLALHDLQSLGVRISLDDFGTGYSCLSHLQRFPFDKLKIDKSFVQDMGSRADSAAIVRAVIGLSRSLRVRTCAEGVETAEQLAFLAREGCDEVQGFYFSRPLPADELTRLYFDARPEKIPELAL